VTPIRKTVRSAGLKSRSAAETTSVINSNARLQLKTSFPFRNIRTGGCFFLVVSLFLDSIPLDLAFFVKKKELLCPIMEKVIERFPWSVRDKILTIKRNLPLQLGECSIEKINKAVHDEFNIGTGIDRFHVIRGAGSRAWEK
jgi:hypothetical protein